MKPAIWFVMSALVVCLGGAALDAHTTTYKGTVVTAEPTTLKVNVVNDKTKKATVMVFEIDKETTIQRGEAHVSFAEARIQKGETVSVTLDIDDGNHTADVIRLAVRK